MADLQEELAKLLNPTPVFKDPEDSDDETGAKLVNFSEEFDSRDVGQSKLRKKTITILEDVDRKYAGKRTSRKDLVKEGEISSEDDGDDSVDDVEEVESEEELDEDDKANDESSDDVSEDENIANFQSKMKLQSAQGEFSFQDDGDYGKYGDDDSEEEEDDDGDDDVEEEEGETDEGDDIDNDDDDDDDEITSEDEGIQKFSVAGSDEVAKGKAAKQQLGLWDSLLEGRIKLQKAVSIINQLPQSDTWTSFEEKTEHFTEEAVRTQQVLKHILDSLVHLQDILLHQNTETKHLAGDGSKSQASSSKPAANIDEDDEEIPSDTDEEMEESKVETKPDVKLGKRKLKMEDYPEFLAKRHTDFQEYRNSTIQRWNDKTQLSGGKIKGKSFSAFDQSAIAQINQILGDKDRLIKRTQLKRSVYKVLGKPASNKDVDVTGDMVTDENRVSQDHLKDYDTEIFDDSDFYHQLLRELIEKKTSDINDPVALSRQWLEIQKLRGKSKKNIDNKASKGRKVRYDVHSKLVNFMAPIDTCDWSDEARDDLFKSLFGKRFASKLS